jgi:hypothetical protein
MRHPICSEDNISKVINRTTHVFSPHVNISIGLPFYFLQGSMKFGVIQCKANIIPSAYQVTS